MITLHLTRAQVHDLYIATVYAYRHSKDVDDMEWWSDIGNLLFEAMDGYDKKHDD